MILLTPTVHHSGSYFLVKHLLESFIELPLRTAREEIARLKPGQRAVVFDHFWPHKMGLWRDLFGRYPIVIPVRRYDKVKKSWEDRGKCCAELDEQWQIMANVIVDQQPFVINLDSTCRDEQLAQINNKLGLDLDARGWPVIHSIGGQPGEDNEQSTH
jgi:hypothetical protein